MGRGIGARAGYVTASRRAPATSQPWRRPGGRQAFFLGAVEAFERGEVEPAEKALATYDASLVAGLSAIDLPRLPGVEIRLAHLDDGQTAGQATVSSDGLASLTLDPRVMRWRLDRGEADIVVQTWLHESVHLRAVPGNAQAMAQAPTNPELLRFPGYEEGLAAGLAEEFCIQSGFASGGHAYEYYVAAWEELATLLGVDPEDFYRLLWEYPVGKIRRGFLGVVGQLYWAQTGRTLSLAQQRALLATADEAFGRARAGVAPSTTDRLLLATKWRRALREPADVASLAYGRSA